MADSPVIFSLAEFIFATIFFFSLPSYRDFSLLLAFFTALYGKETKVRFRPHYFPFTEPSAEADITCFKCKGKDSKCNVCKGSGWIEIGGCGMVNPVVLDGVGIDSEVYSGYAFGLGIERMAMLKYGIPDIRMIYENDLRFLEQF